MIRIWGRPNSINVQKVMWTVAELGLAHERIDTGGVFGGLDAPALAGRNPNRLIPVIDDEGTVVWESNAIVRYLCARWGQGGLWDADPRTRSLADRWMDWQQTTLNPVLSPLFWGLIRTPADERDPVALAGHAERLGELFGVLDAALADRPFVAGDQLTMGDIPVGCAFHRFHALPIERPELPNLARWYGRLAAGAAFRRHVMLPLT